MLVLLGFASSALCYTELYRFQYCAAISADVARLDCYDNFAKELGLPAPTTDGTLSASQSRSGEWTVRAESLPPEETNNVFVFTEAKTVVHGFEGKPMVTTLVARCHANTTELYVAFGNSFPAQAGPLSQSVLYLTQSGDAVGESDVIGVHKKAPKRVRAKIALDGRLSLELMMRPSRDGWGYFFPNPVSFIRQMSKHERMKFTMSTGGGRTMTVDFDLEGMDGALEPLRNSCGW